MGTTLSCLFCQLAMSENLSYDRYHTFTSGIHITLKRGSSVSLTSCWKTYFQYFYQFLFPEKKYLNWQNTMKCAKTKPCLRHWRLLELVRQDWQHVPGKTFVPALPAHLLPSRQRAQHAAGHTRQQPRLRRALQVPLSALWPGLTSYKDFFFLSVF